MVDEQISIDEIKKLLEEYEIIACGWCGHEWKTYELSTDELKYPVCGEEYFVEFKRR